MHRDHVHPFRGGEEEGEEGGEFERDRVRDGHNTRGHGEVSW